MNRHFLQLIAALLLVVPQAYAQIHSTAGGGNWNAATTWVGGTIPGVGDAVQIDGPVLLNTDAECAGLIVSAGAILSNAAWPYTLTVGGSVVNNGTISQHANGWRFSLRVAGNLANHGSWTTHRVTLTGSTTQELTLGTGRAWNTSFEHVGASGYARATTPLTLTEPFLLTGGVLDMNGHSLILDTREGHPENGRILAGAIRSRSDAILGRDTRYVGNLSLHGVIQATTNAVLEGIITVVDTLQSELWPQTLRIEGDLINNGVIRNNPSSWYLYLDVTGNITNRGSWSNFRTRLLGTDVHEIAMGETTPLASPLAFSDTLGQAKATTPLTFANTFDLNRGTLRMEGNALTFENAGVAMNGTIFLDGALSARNNAKVGRNVRYVGDLTLHETIQVQTGVVMEGKVTVVDTLQTESWPQTLRIEGELVNRGVIRNHPSSWYLTLDVTGDLTDQGTVWSNFSTKLAGNGRRTAVAPGITGQVHGSGDYVTLVGSNSLPSLTVSAGLTELAAGASLTLGKATPTGNFVNRGELVFRRNVSAGGAFDFYRARPSVARGTMDTLSIHHFGHQVPATYANAVRSWWRLDGGSGTLDNVYFYYDDFLLGRNDEEKLEVYHSDDEGESWRQISTSGNLTRGPQSDYVKINGAPASGDFLLSSSPDPLSVRPNVVTSITGRSQIRVGPPNVYQIDYVNNSDVSTGDLAIVIETTEGVFIDHIIPSAPPGVTPQMMYPKDFAAVLDSNATTFPDTQALLFVESLGPREERTITLVLGAYPDDWAGKAGSEGPAASRDPFAVLSPDDTEALPILVVYLGYAATGLAVSFVADLATNGVEEVFSSSGGREAGDIADAAWQKTKKDWFGFEKPAKEIFKDLAYTWGPGLILGPSVVFLKMMEFGIGTIGAMGKGADRYLNGDGSQATRSLEKRTSWDPNEKAGPSGAGEAGYMSSAGRLNYQIFFENKKEATAPAWKIVIDDTLSEVFDPSTVVFEGGTHEGWTFTNTDGRLRWEITGIELPPNVTPPEGEGHVSFSVRPRDDLASGTELRNRAIIVFDYNKPIMTNEVVNTLDFLPPVTTMEELPAEVSSDSVAVRWQCDDGPGGSGAFSATVFASVDGGPFQPVGTSAEGWLSVPVRSGRAYTFYALAKDHAGNLETERPETVSTLIVGGVGIEDGPDVYSFALLPNYPNPFNPVTTIRFTLSEPGPVRLRIFDVTGRLVETVVNREMGAGRHDVSWDAGRVASGVYFYGLEQGLRRQVRSLVVVK